MAYGQKNYNEIQGINGKYRIAQIGCFVTSFCNMLTQRFSKLVDPLALNAIFRDRGIYIDVDDGVRDDLGWGSISAAFPDVVVTGVGGAGWPSSNNAIVRFHYKSVTTGKMIDHFCLVADAANHLIVDSWDGVVKAPGIYGNPTGWATYTINIPMPIAPVVPPTPPPVANHYEAITPINFVTNKQPTKVWNLDAQKWGDFQAVQELNQGTAFVAVGIYHHPLNADYYMDAASFGDAATSGHPAHNQGLNHVDLSPAPVVAETPQYTASGTTMPILITPIDPNTTSTITVTNPLDTTTVIPVVGSASPNAWKTTFEEFPAIRKLMATETVNVTDIDGVEVDLRLLKGKQVWVGGVFEKDGQFFYRTQKSILNGWWYGIPVAALGGYTPVDKTDADIDADLNISLIEEAKDLAGKISKRERVVAFIAKVQGFTISLLTLGFLRKNKNKKEA